jgi:hypothetical protein
VIPTLTPNIDPQLPSNHYLGVSGGTRMHRERTFAAHVNCAKDWTKLVSIANIRWQTLWGRRKSNYNCILQWLLRYWVCITDSSFTPFLGLLDPETMARLIPSSLAICVDDTQYPSLILPLLPPPAPSDRWTSCLRRGLSYSVVCCAATRVFSVCS